jgi:TorA maturation chaperone TorD
MRRRRMTLISLEVNGSRSARSVTPTSLLRLAVLRRETYGALGRTFLYPDETVLAGVAETARRVSRYSPWAGMFAFAGPLEKFLCCAAGLGPRSREELQSAYFGLFGSSSLTQQVPLTESAYLEPAAMASGELLVALEREYQSVGVAVSPISGQGPDHVAVELEFVAFLSAREGEAWMNRDAPQALELMQREKRFIEQHPCRWIPSMARMVGARAGSGLYGLAAEAAWAMVAHDADFLGALADSFQVEALR